MTALFPVFGWPFPILAVVFGGIIFNKGRKGMAGTGLAIAGLIMGIISIIFAVLMMNFVLRVGNSIEAANTCKDMKKTERFISKNFLTIP